jgi:hypothetical protein
MPRNTRLHQWTQSKECATATLDRIMFKISIRRDRICDDEKVKCQSWPWDTPGKAVGQKSQLQLVVVRPRQNYDCSYVGNVVVVGVEVK